MQRAAGQVGAARLSHIGAVLAAGGALAAAVVWWSGLERPGTQATDGRSAVLQAHAQAQAENWAGAARGYERAVAASPKVAADPGVWCDWAEALAMTQGGRLQGRPAELVARALELRPGHPKALEMAGSAAFERRDFAQAARHWKQLSVQLEPTSDARRALDAAIDRAERLARTSLPPR